MKTIRELAAALQAGRTTSVEIVEAALTRIADHRAAGGAAYIHVDGERALAAAKASDLARTAGYVPSLLAGLPVSIKDLFDVQGEVTAAGSTVLADRAPAAADAPVVDRLRRAGAILLGRTNMNEFAYSAIGINPHYGTPVNPIDPLRITGGSTAGGGVSVATEMAVMALGTDTGGSVRIPAAFCGVTGFKPTARRVDLSGAVPLSRSLDSCGPLAVSVDCCVLADAVLSGHALDVEALPLDGLRLGVSDDVVGEDLDNAVHRAFEHALRLLERAGVTIQRFQFPELRELPAINSGGGLTAAEAWAWHRTLLASHEDQYDARVSMRIRKGSQQSAADYLDLLDARRRFIATAQQRLSRFDAWLMPTIAVVPPLLEPLEHDADAFFAANSRILRNPTIINFMDGCALTMPCPVGTGLPVGLSICGLHGSDARVLQVGLAVETALRDSSN